MASLLMGATINRSPNLSSVYVAVARRPVHADLASIPIRVWAIQAPPVPLLAKLPSADFGIFDRRLNFLVGVA
jgi:hypothetical protein